MPAPDRVREDIQELAESLDSILDALSQNKRPLDRHWKRARLLADRAHREVHQLLRSLGIHTEPS